MGAEGVGLRGAIIGFRQLIIGNSVAKLDVHGCRETGTSSSHPPLDHTQLVMVCIPRDVTQNLRDELESLLWKTLQDAQELMKTEEAAKNARTRVKVMEVVAALSSVHLEIMKYHKDFRPRAQSYDRPDTMFYCNPAYYGAAPYRKKIQPFTEECHLDLAKIPAKFHGKWLLTYNDHG